MLLNNDLALELIVWQLLVLHSQKIIPLSKTTFI